MLLSPRFLRPIVSTAALALVSVGLCDHAMARDRVFVAFNGLGIVDELQPNGTFTTYATGLGHPEGMAVDSSGNLYVANYGNQFINTGSVLKIAPDQTVTTVASGFTELTGIALDSSGNIYTCNEGAGKVYKITPTGTVSTYASPAAGDAEGLAFDQNGNLYCSSLDHGIKKITPQGQITQFAALNNALNVGLTFDSAGNLYDSSYGEIFKITPTGSTSVYAQVGYSYPAFDSAGNLYVGVFDSPGVVDEVSPNGTVTTLSSGLAAQATGIAIEPAPEPTTLLMLALLGVPLTVRRRSRD